MSNMPPVSEEVIVYGDAPEGNQGGGTDVLSLPRDFYTFYAPSGPIIVNPPPEPPSGGGGGDVADPKAQADKAGDAAVLAGLAFTVIAMIPGIGEVAVTAVGMMGFASGYLAWRLDSIEEDPPEPNYRRPAGSLLPQWTLTLPGPPRLDQALKSVLAAERAAALFVDAMECAQGAFLAADPEWTQRHNEAARDAYRKLGQATLEAADGLQDQTELLRSAPSGPQPDFAAGLPGLLARVRPMLGLSPEDEAHITELFLPVAARGRPTDAEVRSGIETIRRYGRRLVNQEMLPTRFAWPIPEAVRRASGARR